MTNEDLNTKLLEALKTIAYRSTTEGQIQPLREIVSRHAHDVRAKTIDECFAVLAEHPDLLEVSTDYFKLQFEMLK